MNNELITILVILFFCIAVFFFVMSYRKKSCAKYRGVSLAIALILFVSYTVILSYNTRQREVHQEYLKIREMMDEGYSLYVDSVEVSYDISNLKFLIDKNKVHYDEGLKKIIIR